MGFSSRGVEKGGDAGGGLCFSLGGGEGAAAEQGTGIDLHFLPDGKKIIVATSF